MPEYIYIYIKYTYIYIYIAIPYTEYNRFQTYMNNANVRDTRDNAKGALKRVFTTIYDIHMRKWLVAKINIPLFRYIIFIYLFSIYLLLKATY